MKVTPGRCHALLALDAPKACAMPDGTTTSGYKITSSLLDVLGRNGMIQESHLTKNARKKHRIVFVYTISEAGRAWLKQFSLNSPAKPPEPPQERTNDES